MFEQTQMQSQKEIYEFHPKFLEFKYTDKDTCHFCGNKLKIYTISKQKVYMSPNLSSYTFTELYKIIECKTCNTPGKKIKLD